MVYHDNCYYLAVKSTWLIVEKIKKGLAVKKKKNYYSVKFINVSLWSKYRAHRGVKKYLTVKLINSSQWCQ